MSFFGRQVRTRCRAPLSTGKKGEFWKPARHTVGRNWNYSHLHEKTSRQRTCSGFYCTCYSSHQSYHGYSRCINDSGLGLQDTASVTPHPCTIS